jgi:hypothetical protein
MLSVCEDTSNDSDSKNSKTTETSNTKIKFVNQEGYSVTIYRDSLRQQVITQIPKNGTITVDGTPNSAGTSFYPTFHLDLFDMPGVSIPYNGPTIITAIQADKINEVQIPQLTFIETGFAYMKINNNSNVSLTLQQGNQEVNPIGGSSTVITAGKSAVYQVTPGSSSAYSLMHNTTMPVAFPAGFSSFYRGIIYTLNYNGTALSITSFVPMSNDISIPVPGSNLATKLAWLQSNAVSNSSYVIEINYDENITPQSLSYSGKNNISITLNNTGEMRTINLTSDGSLFTVYSGVTLILENNITLNGRDSNGSSLIRVNNGGTMIMNGGKISGNSRISYNSTSHTDLDAAYNLVYYSNYYFCGGGVYNSGIFIMNGGEISDNTSISSTSISGFDYFRSAVYSRGGGVYNLGTFIMNNGKILGNTASAGHYKTDTSGGGVYNEGIFIMSGGEISNNNAEYTYDSTGSAVGGGLSTASNSTLQVSGGVIYGNNASESQKNTASSNGAALFIYYGSSSTQYGIFIGDTFYSSGNLTTTNNTIRVVNGNLLTE